MDMIWQLVLLSPIIIVITMCILSARADNETITEEPDERDPGGDSLN